MMKFTLNPFFYPSDIVQRAAQDYKDVCAITCHTSNSVLTIVLKPNQKSADANIIKYEFCNYVLSIAKSQLKIP